MVQIQTTRTQWMLKVMLDSYTLESLIFNGPFESLSNPAGWTPFQRVLQVPS